MTNPINEVGGRKEWGKIPNYKCHGSPILESDPKKGLSIYCLDCGLETAYHKTEKQAEREWKEIVRP